MPRPRKILPDQPATTATPGAVPLQRVKFAGSLNIAGFQAMHFDRHEGWNVSLLPSGIVQLSHPEHGTHYAAQGAWVSAECVRSPSAAVPDATGASDAPTVPMATYSTAQLAEAPPPLHIDNDGVAVALPIAAPQVLYRPRKASTFKPSA
jgi:hypothetical protein